MIFSKVDGSASFNHYPTDKWDCRCLLSHLITDDIGNRFIFAVLASSASYIAVPADENCSSKQILNFPAYGTSYYFPFNITFGMPIYLSIVLCS
jgi:hypothetical protein